VVVANRLPIEPDGDGGWRRSVGGMVTSLAPIVGARRGVWIGWNQTLDAVPRTHGGIRLDPVRLPTGLADEYYNGFANSTIWPDYHDCLEPPDFRAEWWAAYERVNHIFAAAARRAATRGGTAWIHDYHLQLVPGLLRRARTDVRIGFFLHIPVPGPGAFAQLPHGEEVLRGVLGADVIGVQRPADAEAFLLLAHDVLGVHVEDGAAHYEGRRIEVRAFPGSIDADAIEAMAEQAVARGEVDEVRHRLGDPRTIILGVERLDYTKGVEQRLLAYRHLLAAGRLTAGDTVMLQVLPPSRLGIARYRRLRRRIAELIDGINVDFGRPGAPAVHVWDRPLTLAELVPVYRAADVMAVTPLRDGMNLVAKEYVACRTDLGGVLVLSRYAGAADELRDALLVDPFDPADLRDTIVRAVHTGAAERVERMRGLRASLDGHDARHWGRQVLAHLEGQRGPLLVAEAAALPT
jgi:trehalose 6-phosphate synthase